MRFPQSVLASICVAGVGVLAAGCSSGGSGSSSSSGSSPAASAAGPSASAPAEPTAGTGTGSTAAGQPSGAAAGGGACSASTLGFALGAKSGAPNQQMTQVVDLTNKGSAPCTMTGFPGVDLVGTANGQSNFTWSLVRSSATYHQVTLSPGGTAHFNLTYLPFAAGGGTSFTVAKLVMTPPNTFTQAELTWNQPVLLQDGATHPGTYIGPVTAGA